MNFWAMVVLHRKYYSSKNCQMSALLKIDVFGLAGLQMEYSINFFVLGISSCDVKARTDGIAGRS